MTLRINHRGGAASATYYTKVISKTYYGQENPGFWHGRSTEMLGFAEGQQIEPDDFVNLCHSINPNTGERLNIRQPKRATYDFTFSVPKSVSVIAMLGGDEVKTAIETAFREAVTLTMQDIEQQVATRVRPTPDSDTNRVTGNMIWGEFLETTTRPVGGVPDPHLHIHAVAISTTWDAVEGRRKAAQFGDIKRDAPYYQAVVDARLAGKLTDLGYQVRRSSRQVGNRLIQGWELAHVPDSVNQTFSRRTPSMVDSQRHCSPSRSR